MLESNQTISLGHSYLMFKLVIYPFPVHPPYLTQYIHIMNYNNFILLYIDGTICLEISTNQKFCIGENGWLNFYNTHTS